MSELTPLGQTETGKLFEQEVEIAGRVGNPLRVRRVLLHLFQPTRDQEWEIAILTNLPQPDADAAEVAEVYRRRWTLETLFQTAPFEF